MSPASISLARPYGNHQDGLPSQSRATGTDRNPGSAHDVRPNEACPKRRFRGLLRCAYRCERTIASRLAIARAYRSDGVRFSVESGGACGGCLKAPCSVGTAATMLALARQPEDPIAPPHIGQFRREARGVAEFFAGMVRRDV